MPRDPLEDYAEGIGPGALPQQGSMLPIQTQGGLPFGASSPQAPAKPAPMPGFQAAPMPQQPVQRAPLMSLGGQAPDVNQMLAERLQRFATPQTPGIRGIRDRDMLMEEIKGLTGIANIRSQDRQLEASALKEVVADLDKFHKDYSPDQQRLIQPFMLENLRRKTSLSGMNVPDDKILQALTSRDIASTYSQALNDPLWAPYKDQFLAEAGQARNADETDKVMKRWREKTDADAASTVLSALPQAVAALGGTREQPLDMQKFLTNPEIKKHLDSSPTLQRAFNAYVADPKNEKFLANIGLTTGEGALKTLEGPKMTPLAEEFLASMFTGPNGKPMIPALATTQQITEASAAARASRLDEQKKHGLAAAELAMTQPASAEERDQHIDVDTLVKSGQIVKPAQGISVGDLRKGNFRFARPEQQKALMALQPQRTAFADMNAMADRLITANTWQEGIAQGLRLYRTSRTGEDKLAAAYLKSTAAATSYLARMVESGVMTDADVARWEAAAVASFFDTKGARDIKRALMGDIIDAAQAAVISQVAGVPMKAPEGLRKKLEELDRLTRDTWKNTKAGIGADEMLITDGEGQYAKMKRGTKLTGPWKEVK